MHARLLVLALEYTRSRCSKVRNECVQEASEAKEKYIDAIKQLCPDVASPASGEIGKSRTNQFESFSQSHYPRKYAAAANPLEQRLKDQKIWQQERQDAEDWRQGSAQLQESMLRRLDVSVSL
jgi:hypothetical protein